MSEGWSAGTFLARARELNRRLNCWHFEDPFSPGHIASEEESRRWVRRTFREITTANPGNRPKSIQIYHHEDGQPDEHGCVGVVYNNPERPEDHSLTQWLISDFRAHLHAAGPLSPALDYLKETFAHLLDLPAWTVRGPGTKAEEAMLRKSSRQYLVVGHPVPAEYLDALTDAAEKLLTASNTTAPISPARQNDSGVSPMQYPPVDLTAIFEESVAREKYAGEVETLRAKREAKASAIARAVRKAEKALAEAVKEFDGPGKEGTVLAAQIVELCRRLKADAKFHNSVQYETNIKTPKRTLFAENVQKVADRIFLIGWEGNTDELAKNLDQAKETPLWPKLKDYLLRGYQQKVLGHSGYREFAQAPDESGAMVWEETRYYDLVRNPMGGSLEGRLSQVVVRDLQDTIRKDTRLDNGQIFFDHTFDANGDPVADGSSLTKADTSAPDSVKTAENRAEALDELDRLREKTADQIIENMIKIGQPLTAKQIAEKLGMAGELNRVRVAVGRAPEYAKVDISPVPRGKEKILYRIEDIVPILKKLLEKGRPT